MILLIYALLFGEIITTPVSSNLKAWQEVKQRAPRFSQAVTKWAPQIRSWLEDPDAPFSLFAPVDDGCTLEEYAEDLNKKGLNAQQMDAVIRYHVASGRLSITGQPDLLETALEGTGSTGSSSFNYLPQNHRQRLKLYRDGAEDKVFDGELPPATILQVISCVDGLVVLLDRTLFPPLVMPGSIATSTPVKAVLESILQSGMGDYRTTPLTLLLPASPVLSAEFLSNPQLAGAHVCAGIYYSSDLHSGMVLHTLTSERITITDDGHHFYASGVRLLFYDVPTSFGVVHVLERDLKNIDTSISASWQENITKNARAYVVRSLPAAIGHYSTATCLMVAGGIAFCMAVGYIVYRKRQY